jgi:hypothetical protein
VSVRAEQVDRLVTAYEAVGRAQVGPSWHALNGALDIKDTIVRNSTDDELTEASVELTKRAFQ